MASSSTALDLLQQGVPDSHDGFQLYVSVGGETMIDAAGGNAQPDIPMTTDSLTLWFSAGKPITAVAIVQLWEQGNLGLDDRVAEYVPEFGNGKESATIRHLLTHRGGFPFADDSLHPGPWPSMVAQICAAPAQWCPGEAAGYHGTPAWVILAEVVSRVSGQPFEKYVSEHVFAPLGMTGSRFSVPPDQIADVRPQLALIQDNIPKTGEGIGMLSFGQYNDDALLPLASPGNTARGPARELGRLFAALADGGAPVLGTTAAEAMLACHRLGFEDTTYAMNPDGAHPVWGFSPPWALGMAMCGNADIGCRTSRRVVSSSGAFSSVGLADPETKLSCVVVTTGLIPLAANTQRLARVVDAVHDDVGM